MPEGTDSVACGLAFEVLWENDACTVSTAETSVLGMRISQPRKAFFVACCMVCLLFAFVDAALPFSPELHSQVRKLLNHKVEGRVERQRGASSG